MSSLTCSVACEVLVPWPASPALEDRFLTTGPPGKSLAQCFKVHLNAQKLFWGLWVTCVIWEMKLFPAVLVNKDVTVNSYSSPPISEPWEHPGKRTVSAIGQPLGCSCSLRWALRNSEYWPDSWDAYDKKWFQQTQTLASSHTQKSSNSLTWYIWFSLINNNFLLFRLPAPCCKLLHNLTPPSASLELFSESLETLSPGLEVLKISTE